MAEQTPQTVYVLIGHEGEWSSLIVWVAGVFTDEATARNVAEEMKIQDRSNHVIWLAWLKRFWSAGDERGLKWDSRGMTWAGLGTRAEAVAALGIGVEPPTGKTDSEYFVAPVPLDERGRWDYE